MVRMGRLVRKEQLGNKVTLASAALLATVAKKVWMGPRASTAHPVYRVQLANRALLGLTHMN